MQDLSTEPTRWLSKHEKADMCIADQLPPPISALRNPSGQHSTLDIASHWTSNGDRLEQ